MSGKIMFCIVNEHTADDLSVNRMMKVSANLSKNSLDQWKGLEPDSSPVSMSFNGRVQLKSGLVQQILTSL